MPKGINVLYVAIIVIIIIAIVGIFLFSRRPGRPFDFSISANPNSGSVLLGKSTTTIVKAVLTSGSKESVSFSCSNLPSGASCKFSRPKCSPTCRSTVTVSTSASTQSGTYNIKISATGGGKTRDTTYSLTVSSTPLPFDFSVSLDPTSDTVQQGQSTLSTVTVGLVSGTTQPVSLSVSGCPSEATCTVLPTSGNPTYTSTLSISTSSTTPTGTYIITVSGTGGGKTKTATFSLAVSSVVQPFLLVSANPVTITTAQSSTITATTSDSKAGVSISFSTDIGSLNPATCVTLSTGLCSVSFSSTETGTATITATATGYTSGSTGHEILKKGILIGARVVTLSYGDIETSTQSEVEKELNDMKDLGIEAFSIHLNYDPYRRGDQQRISLMESSINKIKQWGKILHISESAAESYWGAEIPWDEWKILHKDRLKDIASRYKPDYLTIVHEPRWYEDGAGGKGMISHLDTSFRGRENEEWAEFIPELTSTVKSVSPNTKTIVALVPQLKDDQELLSMINTIPDLDVLGFDPYGGVLQFTGYDYLNIIESLIPHTGKKELMLQETWAQGSIKPVANPNPEIESEWIKTTADFASNNSISTVIYFHLTARVHEPLVKQATEEVIQKY